MRIQIYFVYKRKSGRANAGRIKNALVLVSLAILLAVLLQASSTYFANSELEAFVTNTTSLDGAYVENSNLYFYRGCSGIKMGITEDQAYSIREAMVGKVLSRPLTHDLFEDVMEFYGIGILHAKLDSMDGGIYKAKILFYGNFNVYEVDSRPSDMAAMSLRYGNKISINNALLWNFTNIC